MFEAWLPIGQPSGNLLIVNIPRWPPNELHLQKKFAATRLQYILSYLVPALDQRFCSDRKSQYRAK